MSTKCTLVTFWKKPRGKFTRCKQEAQFIETITWPDGQQVKHLRCQKHLLDKADVPALKIELDEISEHTQQ